jgi:TIR domain/PASTA domain
MAEPTPTATGRVFISYRRTDTDYPASWLYHRLGAHYGIDRVFKDVDSIAPGEDFAEAIAEAVGSCDVLLAVIGDQWLTMTDEQGRRRLDDGSDLVRLEIEGALARNVRVIPVLVGRARMPTAEELPDSLAKLARRQALELSPARFESDLGRLLRVLTRTLEEQARHATEAPPGPPTREGPAPQVGAAEDTAPADTSPRPPPAGTGAVGARPRIPLVLGAVLLVAALAVGFILLSSRQAGARVPDLAGVDSRTATQQLKELRLASEVRYRSDPAPEGSVLATDPPAGKTVGRGATVVMYVSAGPDTTAVPVVRGARRDEAERRLRAAGFAVDVDEVRVSDADQDGVAIGTDPPAGAELPQGASVHLKVGASPEPPTTASGDSRTEPTPPTSAPHPTPTATPTQPPTPTPTQLPPPSTGPQPTLG